MAYDCILLASYISCCSQTDHRVGDLPKHAANFGARVLALSPLLKTSLMDIIPARSFTPYDFLAPRLKFCEADRAVAGNSFPLSPLAGGVRILRS